MIVEKMFDFLGSIVMGILKLFNIPGIPDDVLQSAYNFLDFLFSNASLLGLFIRPKTIQLTAVLLLVILNFEHLYNLTKWLVNKIPFSNKFI